MADARGLRDVILRTCLYVASTHQATLGNMVINLEGPAHREIRSCLLLQNLCKEIEEYLCTIADIRAAVLAFYTPNKTLMLRDRKTIDDEVAEMASGPKLRRSINFVRQLALIFHQLEHDPRPSITPTIELAKLALKSSNLPEYGAKHLENSETRKYGREPHGARSDRMMVLGYQQDIMECLDNCLVQLETALMNADAPKYNPDENLIKRLFYGRLVQRIVEESPKSDRPTLEKEDIYSHLPLGIPVGSVDLYDVLDGHFSSAVESQGAQCQMNIELIGVPPLLQIQLKRALFNPITQQPYKDQARVILPDTLFLDRYLSDSDEDTKAKSMSIRKQISRARERLQSLKQTRDAEIHASQGERKSTRREIDSLKLQISALKTEAEKVWAGYQEMAYQLASVFIHEGTSTSGGHYYFYSRNLPAHPDEWLKYDDSAVSVVDAEEVYADTAGRSANAYFLVYARKGSGIIRTINRIASSI
ncbi:hypothetical protein EV715DRAFT_298007 [Schizophyllum commune]